MSAWLSVKYFHSHRFLLNMLMYRHHGKIADIPSTVVVISPLIYRIDGDKRRPVFEHKQLVKRNNRWELETQIENRSSTAITLPPARTAKEKGKPLLA